MCVSNGNRAGISRRLILAIAAVAMCTGICLADSAETKSATTYEWLSDARFISWRISGFCDLETARKHARKLKATGANTVITFGFHYRFQYVEDFPKIKQNLKNIVTACHEIGLRVIEHHSATFVPPDKLKSVVNGIPLTDCTVISARDGKPPYFEQYKIIMLCCNNPKFRKIYFDYVLDLAKETGIDALMSDDIEFCPDWYVCSCKYCREKFKKSGGCELPNGTSDQWGNHNDPWFRQWQKFRMRSVGDYYVDLRKEMDNAGLQIPLLGCLAGASNLILSQNWGMTGEEFARGVDLNFYEAWFTCSNLYVWRAQAAEINYYLGIGRRFGQQLFTLNYTRSEEDLFFMWAFNLVQGDRLWLNTIPAKPEETFDWEKKHEELFRFPKTLSNIAFLFSRQTRDVYGGFDEKYYLHEWRGWSEMLTETNIPYDTVLDADLTENLSRYKLLILPNAACLSNDQVAGIRRYVEKGGKVIATHDLARYDETGAKRNRSALADWISAPPAGVTYYAEKVGATQIYPIPLFSAGVDEIKWTDTRDMELRQKLLAKIHQAATPLPWRLAKGNAGVLANMHRVTGQKGDFLVAHLLNVAPLALGKTELLRRKSAPPYNPQSFPGPVTLEFRANTPKSATLYSPDNTNPTTLPITANGDAWQITIQPNQIRRYGAIKIDIE